MGVVGRGSPCLRDLELIVSQVLAASPDAEHRRILDRLRWAPPGANAAEIVAGCGGVLREGEIPTRRAAACRSPPRRAPRNCRRTARALFQPRGASWSRARIRVVNMVNVDGSPVGGVMTWALRSPGRCRRTEFDAHRSLVVNFADALHARGFDIDDGPRRDIDLCVLDDLMDTHEHWAPAAVAPASTPTSSCPTSPTSATWARSSPAQS